MPAMELSERQHHVLQFFYENQDSCCIDEGNIMWWYATQYDDWKDDKGKHRNFTLYGRTVDGLIEKGLIARDEPPLDCFIHITEEGIRYYG